MAVGQSLVTHRIGSADPNNPNELEMFLDSDGHVFVYVSDGEETQSLSVTVDLDALEYVVGLLRREAADAT